MDEQPERPETPPETPGAPARETAAEAPDFGPGGYLPDRASRRARKIVLRAPMGIQWVIGALVVGVLVVVAGVLLLQDEAPGPPYVALEVTDGTALQTGVVDLPDGGGDVLVIGVGRPRVFAVEGAGPAYCEESGLLEGGDGTAWRITGRGMGGTPSLAEHPSLVHDGTLYVDPTTTLEPLTPDPDPAETACS